jgi:alkylation response protein AidB-like acyl-CoA dehydrogenase
MTILEDATAWVEATWRLDMKLSEWWQALAEAGFAFPHWPSGFGGRDLTPAEGAAIQQVLGAHGVIGPPTGNAINMGVPTLLVHGTPEQQERFIPPTVNGQRAWCQLFSEPGAGSDLGSLSCKAERDGDELVVTGQKVWNSSADVSEWGMLLARTDPDVPKHAGLTWMMIDMRQPGVEVRPLVQMNGSAEFCEVFLTEARVPLDNVIGGLGSGWNVARTTLLHERGAVGRRAPKGLVEVRAGTLGGNLHRRVGDLIERAKAAARDPRKRRDVMVGSTSMIRLARELGLANDPVVRDRVAEYFVHSEVYRLTGLRARAQAKSGRAGPESSILKLGLALLAHRSRDLSMSMLGAEGMLNGDDAREQGKVQHACLSSLAPSIGGGTNEIQRNIIGERVLGLPREPSIDKEAPFRELRRS